MKKELSPAERVMRSGIKPVTLPDTDFGSQQCPVCFERCKPSAEIIWKCEHCSAGLVHEACCNAEKTCHTCEKRLARHVVAEPPPGVVVDLTMHQGEEEEDEHEEDLSIMCARCDKGLYNTSAVCPGCDEAICDECQLYGTCGKDDCSRACHECGNLKMKICRL